MAQQKEIAYWEPDNMKGETLSPWMLLDWHREGRIDAGAKDGEAYSPGDRLSLRLLTCKGLGPWMKERLTDSLNLVWLIPFDGARWFVIPDLYLATGHLLLVRAPAPEKYAVAIAESGALGEIAVFPGSRADADWEKMDVMIHSCRDVLRTVLACFPQGKHGPEEFYRILRAVATWTGTRLNRTLTAGRFIEAYTETVSSGSDPALFSAMMLMILSALSRCRSGSLTVIPEQGEEGSLFSFKASSVQSGALLQESAEIAACRSLSERNCLVFDCTVRGKTFRGHMCVTRKEFSLLGMKTENDME